MSNCAKELFVLFVNPHWGDDARMHCVLFFLCAENCITQRTHNFKQYSLPTLFIFVLREELCFSLQESASE
jgi:hypothetical protein